MARHYYQTMFTDSVRQAQERNGSGHLARQMEAQDMEDQRLGPAEQAFISQCDSFYMSTVSSSGWPYVQHRGGPVGFLRPLDESTLAFADFRGNRQYISVGHLGADDRVALFLMDYAERRRLKILAHAASYDAMEHPAWVAKVEDPTYRARIERVIVLKVVAFDWNCPQHITQRFTAAQWRQRS